MHIRNLSLVVAMTDHGVIGRDGRLPWEGVVDAKWFRDNTVHQSLIMGRKTYDSIIAHNGKPLDRRTSIVLSTRKWDETWPSDGVDRQGTRWARNLLEALDMASWGWNGGGTTAAMVIGGAKVYEVFLPFADTIYLTLVETDHEGDVVFPGGLPGLPTWQHKDKPLKFGGFSCHILGRTLPVVRQS